MTNNFEEFDGGIGEYERKVLLEKMKTNKKLRLLHTLLSDPECQEFLVKFIKENVHIPDEREIYEIANDVPSAGNH
jgi:hypothetical protein